MFNCSTSYLLRFAAVPFIDWLHLPLLFIINSVLLVFFFCSFIKTKTCLFGQFQTSNKFSSSGHIERLISYF